MTNNEAARERVIKGLEQCSLGDGRYCDECPYHYSDTMFNSCSVYLMRDALELLKAQEPKDALAVNYENSIILFSCRVCETQLTFGQRYCHMCGQAVKWE